MTLKFRNWIYPHLRFKILHPLISIWLALFVSPYQTVWIYPEPGQTNLLSSVISTNSTLPPDISFSCNWEIGITGDGCWKGMQVVASDRMQRVSDPVKCCGYAVRVEVRPGDDPINSSGERAEVVNMTDASGNIIYENLSSGTQYYGFSVLLDPSWPVSITNRYAIILQLHGPDAYDTPPAFAIEARDKFSVDMTTGNIDGQLVNHYYQLSKNNLNLGHWVDFIVMIKYAKDTTGAVSIWRRDEGSTGFTQVLSVNNIATLQYRASLGSVQNHYWKYGLYRTSNPTVTDVLWLGGMTRGTSFVSVLRSAFNMNLSKREFLPVVLR